MSMLATCRTCHRSITTSSSSIRSRTTTSSSSSCNSITSIIVRRSFHHHNQQQKQQQQPHFSKRNKRDFLILTMGACYVVGYYLTSNEWDDDVRTLKNKLLSSSSVASVSSSVSSSSSSLSRTKTTLIGANNNNNNNNNKRSTLTRSSYELPSPIPPSVERNIKKASSLSSTKDQIPSSELEVEVEAQAQADSTIIATITQSGEFLALRQWYPFTSDLLIVSPSTPSSSYSSSSISHTSLSSTSSTTPSSTSALQQSNTNNNKSFGFVWDVKTTIFNLSHRIVESYIYQYYGGGDNNGYDCHPEPDGRERERERECERERERERECIDEEGAIRTKLWGIFPFCVQMEEEDPYILFWLALSTPLFPMKLLVENRKLLKWIPQPQPHYNDDDNYEDNNNVLPSLSSSSSSIAPSQRSTEGNTTTNTNVNPTAELRIQDDQILLLEFIFDEEHDLLTSIKVTGDWLLEDKTKNAGTTTTQPTYWQVFYNDYQYIPTTTSTCNRKSKSSNGISTTTITATAGDDDNNNDTTTTTNNNNRCISTSVLVPTTIEIGKGWKDDTDSSAAAFQAHFRISTHHIKYRSHP